MSSEKLPTNVNADEYRRAVVEAFLYYLSSHSKENETLLVQGVKEGLKEWLGDARESDRQQINPTHGVATEFHEVLEDLYALVDDYGQASREWGRARELAQSAGRDPRLEDNTQAYEAEKHLKQAMERIVNENIRLRRIADSVSAPTIPPMQSVLAAALKEWLNENSGRIMPK